MGLPLADPIQQSASSLVFSQDPSVGKIRPVPQPKRPLYCSFVDGVLQDLRLGVKIWCDVDVNNRADDVEEGAVVTMPGAPIRTLSGTHVALQF